jgi:hypothetical protein
MASPESPTPSCAANGAWDRLSSLEFAAQGKIAIQLVPFEQPFRDAYEAGVIVPVLRAGGSPAVDVRVAALFHKRMLNDLRGVWLMLCTGYTSQAASIAASLYESALAATCLTISSANVAKLLQQPEGEIPWKITEMAQMVIAAEGKTVGADYENQWRALYAHYVWLCQIKHASSQSVVHDTTGTALEKGYVVMALPNVRDEDMPIKAMVAIISLHRALDGIAAFAKALGFVDPLPDDYRFAERYGRARDLAWKAFEPYLKVKSSIGIERSRFTRRNPPV